MKHSFLLLLMISATIASAQTIEFNGQIRERSEFDSRSVLVGTVPDAFHLLRSRFGVTARLDSQLSAVIEVQDARTFGATRSTLNTGSPALDLRQAHIDIRNIGGLPLAVKLGRQVIGYANERLLGKIDWSNVGQSFDGGVASLGLGPVTLDLIGTAIARNPNTQGYSRDHFLAGAWTAWKPTDVPTSLQAYYLFDDPKLDSIRQNRHTVGLYSNGQFSGFDYEVDGAIQFGDYIRSGEFTPVESSIAASLLGARVGYSFSDLAGLRLGIGFDRLSGQAPDTPEEYGAFSTLYGTNHKFYGTMDLLDNTSQLRGLGLQDMMFQVSLVPLAAVKLSADLHRFSLASDITKVAPGFSQQIGHEFDLTLGIKASNALNVTAGYSVFDGDRDRYVIRGRKTTQWAFVMTTVGF